VAGYFLDNNTDSPIPYWDAFTTSGSIVATWMLARKMIENWIFWVVIDFVALGTYLYKGLFATTVLFLVYTFMAVIGFYKWKKSLKV
jgi:nicotinamide mononucleotide transporter